MIEDAKKAILASSNESTIYIGCDSLRYKNKHGQFMAKYSTVIVLHYGSRHGCKIFHDRQILPDYGNLKQRLLTETQFAVNTAMEILDVIGDRKLEIHLDLNPNPKHKSNIAVKEALAWVKGMTGLDAVIKSNSWAATHCADHVVRNINGA